MTLWIRIDANIGDHPNVWKLAELRGVSAVACVGHLVMLFGNVAEYRANGDVSDVPDHLLERWAGWAGEAGLFAASFRELFVSDGVIDGWAERQGKLIERAEKEKERWHRRKHRGDSAEESAARNGTVRNKKKEKKEPTVGTPRVVVADPAAVDAVLSHYRSAHPRKHPDEKGRKAIIRALATYSAADLCEAVDGNARDDWARRTGNQGLPYLLRDNATIDKYRALASPPTPIAIVTESRGRVLLDICRRYDLFAYNANQDEYEAKLVKASTDPLAGPDFREECRAFRPWRGIAGDNDHFKAQEIEKRLAARTTARAS